MRDVTRSIVRRQRRATVAAGLMVAIVAVGAGAVLLVGSDPDRSSLTVTTDGAERPLEPQRGARRGLPIGEGRSPYWVAHELPRGYEIVSASDERDPLEGGFRAHVTSYHDGRGDDFDAALRVTTIEGDVGAAKPGAGDAPPRGADKVTVRGRDGLQFARRDDGQEYGTSLLWEQRPGLWILVEAAEPLTGDDAFSVAAGLEPYPADQWSDLLTGVDIMGSYEPSSTDGFMTASLGAGTTDGALWTFDALIPPRYGELPADRRTSCARLTVDAVTLPEIACLSRPRWIATNDQVFVIGLAPAEARSVTVQTAAARVKAELFTAEYGPDVQYWVATLGSVDCQEVQVSLTPKGLDDEIASHMIGPMGPGGGCATAPGGVSVPPTGAGPSPGGAPVPPTGPVDPPPGG